MSTHTNSIKAHTNSIEECLIEFVYKLSLSKKFYSSQAQRAGYRQNLESPKKIAQAGTFFLPKHLERNL